MAIPKLAIVLGLVMVGIGVFSALELLDRKEALNVREDWPQTVGRVLDTRVERIDGYRSSDTYEVRINFDYTYQGVFYVNSQTYSTGSDSNQARRDEAVYTAGQRVAVWVNPEDPTVAAVRPDEVLAGNFWVAAGQIIGLGGVGIIGWSAYVLWNHRRGKSTGVASSRERYRFTGSSSS